MNKYIKLMKDKYEEILIVINAKSGTVKISGKRMQIEDAKQTMKQILDKIEVKLVKRDPVMLKLISEKEKFMANWLKEKSKNNI